ncbi:hypothetical protein GGX14DRAFT_571869 [Mycena pura]|uniref:Uncharacterized protein n=1 Tax=Mycena pura TaxID=153505 RepID=A0AAD6V2Y7_9AGAR|nr:hypothetical protein GGX14DRAFT_571869 [Mycena pura]
MILYALHLGRPDPRTLVGACAGSFLMPRATAARTRLRTLVCGHPFDATSRRCPDLLCAGSCLMPRAAAARTRLRTLVRGPPFNATCRRCRRPDPLCARSCSGSPLAPQAATAQTRPAHAPTSVRRLVLDATCRRGSHPPAHTPAAARTGPAHARGSAQFRSRRLPPPAPRRPRAAALQRAAPCRARPRHARARGFAFAPCDTPTPCDAPAAALQRLALPPSNAPAPRRCRPLDAPAPLPSNALQRAAPCRCTRAHVRGSTRWTPTTAAPVTPPRPHPPTPRAAALQRPPLLSNAPPRVAARARSQERADFAVNARLRRPLDAPAPPLSNAPCRAAHACAAHARARACSFAVDVRCRHTLDPPAPPLSNAPRHARCRRPLDAPCAAALAPLHRCPRTFAGARFRAAALHPARVSTPGAAVTRAAALHRPRMLTGACAGSVSLPAAAAVQHRARVSTPGAAVIARALRRLVFDVPRTLALKARYKV